MRSAGPDMGTMAATATASLVAAWLGDRLGMLAMGATDPVGELLGGAAGRLPSDILGRPLALSAEPLPALTALSAFCGTWEGSWTCRIPRWIPLRRWCRRS